MSNVRQQVAHTLLERITNKHGTTWLRAHGYGIEGFALCSTAVHPDVDGVTKGQDQITCPDCIWVVEACKAIDDHDLAPEYQNGLFSRRFEKDQ
jgi:hypothetical protein